MKAGAAAAPGPCSRPGGETFQLGPARVRFTTRADGDMGHGGEYAVDVDAAVAARRRAVLDLPWVWLRQVHGGTVVVARPPAEGAGSRADAAVTTHAGCPLAVLAADCAPVALASAEGVIAAAHAGWLGLVNGVIERTVERMRELGATAVRALVGPCIRAECYEFTGPELALVTRRYGDGVVSQTSKGTVALDIPATVRSALGGCGVDAITDTGVCTACSADYFSWRGRKERQRHAMLVWR